MLSDAIKDVKALPRVLTKADLKELGWSLSQDDDYLYLRKGSLEIIFGRLPYSIKDIAFTMDFKKLIISNANAELRYVNNESPYIKSLPCVSYWGGFNVIKSSTDELGTLLYNIAFKLSGA